MKNQTSINCICEDWLSHIYLHVKYASYVQYERIIHTHICYYFDNLEITQFSYSHLEGFIHYLVTQGNRKKNCGLSAKSINDILVVLKSVFNYYNMVEINNYSFPCIRLMKDPVKTVKVFYETDYIKLEKYLVNNTNLSKLGILICMYTGLRLGEVCALQWKNIDLSKKLLSVCQTVYRTKNPDCSTSSCKKTKIIVSSPKTENSIRNIPISEKLLPILIQFSSLYNGNQYILTGCDSPMDPRTYQYQYKKHLQACNVPYLNFHCLRHTFSTRCIEKGCDIKSLSEMLGHSSTNITLKKYIFSSYHQKKRFIDLL